MSSPDKAREKLAQVKDRCEATAEELGYARADRDQAILDAKKAGLTMTEIAELGGVSRFTAHAIVRAES